MKLLLIQHLYPKKRTQINYKISIKNKKKSTNRQTIQNTIKFLFEKKK
jgi:hypothetical protein